MPLAPGPVEVRLSEFYKAQNIKAGATAAYDGVSFTIPAIYNNSKAQVLVSKPGM